MHFKNDINQKKARFIECSIYKVFSPGVKGKKASIRDGGDFKNMLNIGNTPVTEIWYFLGCPPSLLDSTSAINYNRSSGTSYSCLIL